MRGYPEVEELTKKSKVVPKKVLVEDIEPDSSTSTSSSSSSSSTSSLDEDPTQLKEDEKQILENNEVHDYDNENSEEEVRKIDHLMFVIHG